MNRRREFIFAGLKQAGRVFGAILLLGLLAVLFLWLSFHWGTAAHPNMLVNGSRDIGMVTTGFAVCFLSGPMPTIAALFDITNRQLWVLSCVLIISYWAGLGVIAGIMKFHIHQADAWRQDNLSAGQIARHIRGQIGIIAFLLAIPVFPAGPYYELAHLGLGHDLAGSKRMAIYTKLLRIEAAKEQFALDKKISPGYVPLQADLAPYVSDGTNFFRPAAGWPIRYILNAINQPAYATVDKDWRIRRSGWREGHTFTNRTVFSINLN